LIHNIYCSSTRQQPVKDPKQGTARYFLGFPKHQTLPLTTTLNLIFSLLSMICHLLFHSTKALLGLLWHAFFSWKRVAPQIQLPAGDAVHHSWVAMQPLASYTADRFYELSIRFWPLVEVHVIGTDRHPRVTCIIDTVWYANWAHFIRGFDGVIRSELVTEFCSGFWTIYCYSFQGLDCKKRYMEKQERERGGELLMGFGYSGWVEIVSSYDLASSSVMNVF